VGLLRASPWQHVVWSRQIPLAERCRCGPFAQQHMLDTDVGTEAKR
jgi:hypothetical protein